jgi:hypothetical protein
MNPTGTRARGLRPKALAGMLLLATGIAGACGPEDPSSIAMRRGVPSLADPQSPHVGTAVWQAQIAGRLRRDALAQRDDRPPEARAQLRLMRANAQLQQLALRLAAAMSQGTVKVYGPAESLDALRRWFGHGGKG